ncbi:MAG: N-acetylneuraminate synthase [Acidobacteria bacterium]|mgnify:CR=1 FL=1|nr:MAG: N-acetylneuraminate synthase [Acidobacteriota bacterium]REK07293.1 MAG: N-acetylneuraminate synthase [Acidobacteriota bacterium]
MSDPQPHTSDPPRPPGEPWRRGLAAWFQHPDRPVLLVAEVAQAHDGSLGTAHAFVDLVADSGVDAIKFQTHIADAESTPDEPWRVRFSPQDERRIDYWRRMEFRPDQWAELKRHAEERGLIFLSSPFSLAAFELLEGLGIEGWKVASGELNNLPLLDAIRSTGKPILLSTGMSDWAEIDAVVARLRGDAPPPLAIFQCTSQYPCPPEKVGLNLVDELAARYRCPAGLSDHSGTIYPILAGVARGLALAEFHVTLSRHAFGPDVPASLTPEQVAQLVEGVRTIERMLAHPVDKSAAAAALAPMRALFQRSLVAARDMPAGHRLRSGDLVAKKPGTGVSPEREAQLLGRRLAHAVEADRLLRLDDLEAESGDPEP